MYGPSSLEMAIPAEMESPYPSIYMLMVPVDCWFALLFPAAFFSNSGKTLFVET